jgi:magnesium transporter
MIRSLYHTHDNLLHTDLSIEALATALEDEQGLLWLDLAEEPPDACLPILRDVFEFHPLAVDDALEEAHVPKVDDWGSYLYLVLHAVTFVKELAREKNNGEALQTRELDIFLGKHYLITHHTEPIAALNRTWAACQRRERCLQKGPAHLLYTLADELATDYMPVVDQIDEGIDRIEDQIFADPAPSVLEQIFMLKRALLRLRRVIAPQREVLNKLARRDYATIEPESRVFFRDVYDHLVRLYDLTESLRDLVSSALDTYLSVVNNRMNEVMKILTVITTLFMPLSFLVGFFGMNFFQPVMALNAWTRRIAFALTLTAMLIVPIGMYVWMRNRAWM